MDVSLSIKPQPIVARRKNNKNTVEGEVLMFHKGMFRTVYEPKLICLVNKNTEPKGMKLYRTLGIRTSTVPVTLLEPHLRDLRISEYT